MASFTSTIRFDKLPSVLDILVLLENRTGFKYRIVLESRLSIHKEQLIDFFFFNTTPILSQIEEYYRIKKTFYYGGSDFTFALDTNTIHAFTAGVYEVQVFRQILSDLGTICEEGGIYAPEGDNHTYITGDLRKLDPIPHYAILPWFHKDIPISFLTTLRNEIGWNPKNRPPFVSAEFIAQIERGMTLVEREIESRMKFASQRHRRFLLLITDLSQAKNLFF